MYLRFLCSNVWYQFGRVSPSSFFVSLFLIDFSAFYKQSSHFLRAFSMSVILRWSRALMGLQQLNVGKCGASCSPQRFGAWWNCRAVVRSCPLSLSDKYLVGMNFWSVFVSSPHVLHKGYTTRNLLISFSRGDSSPSMEWGGAWLVLFITQQLLLMFIVE